MNVLLSLYRIVDNTLHELQPMILPEEKLYPLLENNPKALLPGEEEQLIILGRKIICSGLEVDLLGIDSNGNLIIIEVKGSSRSREVIAQILEYATCVESWGVRELKESLIKKASLNIKEDFIPWIRNRFKQYYGEEVNITEDNINIKQRLILFLPYRDPRLEKMVEYLRKRGLDIYYILYNLFKEKDLTYMVSYTIVGSEVEPIKKLQALEIISIDEFIDKLSKNNLNNIADVLEQLSKQDKAWTKRQATISLADGKIKIYINDPETYPRAWIYVNDENILDRVIKIAEQLNLPIKKEKVEKFKPGTAPIIFQGITGLQQLDKVIKQLIKMLE